MNEALRLMLTGMSTVFFILVMVVVLGNVIIRITNKFASVPVTLTAGENNAKSEIEPAKMAAIISAVQISTQGKGNVTSIERMKSK